jgi:fructose-1,6-bisphosphatase/inositol monophosphatase family enzyme
MAAGSLIVKEARGMISNLQGEPLELKRQNIIAGNKPIYAQLKRHIDDALQGSARKASIAPAS